MNKRMKLAAAVACFSILIGSFATSAQTRKHRRGVARRVAIARRVGVVDLNGLKSLLKRDPAHPLLVNFWATWCDPCRDEFPDLVKIDAAYRSQGLDFIAITLDDLKDLKTGVRRFLAQMHAKMPVYLVNEPDPDVVIRAIDAEWKGALPATFLYDPTGKVAYRHFGRIDAKELRAEIDKLIGNKAPAGK